MKTNFKNLGALTIAFSVALFSCEKSQDLAPTTNNATLSKGNATTQNWLSDESLKTTDQEKVLAVGCENYSLVLAAVTGTPHTPGHDSYLVNVDMVTGASTASSPITVGGAFVKTATGITKPAPAAGAVLYGVTGQNSSIPNRLIRINPATGASVILGFTTMGGVQVSLQDIEYSSTSGRYYAIKEGTNQILQSLNGLNWTNFAIVPTNYRLNGLTFRTVGGITSLWVIAGASNFTCGPNYGDMWEYSLAGALIGTRSYNAATTGPVNPELGLDYFESTACGVSYWAIGSANGVLSRNAPALCPNIPGPIGAGSVKATYDFAKR